jgi:DnaJ-class molecular chaperone
VQLRVKALPNFRFKTRGSDLRCDLKIKTERAAQGGVEMIRGLTGAMLRVPIPRGVGARRNHPRRGEGLPKPRGGRGDLLVRITYSRRRDCASRAFFRSRAMPRNPSDRRDTRALLLSDCAISRGQLYQPRRKM